MGGLGRPAGQSGIEGLPDGRAIIESFETGAEPDASALMGVARQLCRHHLGQWEAEDRARRSRGDATVLAGIKREIDDMNMRRSRLIDEIDDWVAEHVRQAEDAPLHTETLGSIVDRLAIAWVRRQKLRAKESGAARPPGSCGSELAARQLAELGQAYDVLLGEVESRQRRIPGWRLMKSYG